MNENAKYYDEKSKVRTMKYQQTHCERITTWVKRGDKERYKKLAETCNMSLNALIIQLLEEKFTEMQGKAGF